MKDKKLNLGDIRDWCLYLSLGTRFLSKGKGMQEHGGNYALN